MRSFQFAGPALAVLALGAAGCMSPYRADQGALYGGLTGAGVGALVGEAVDQPLAGAAIGGVVGTLSGAAVGGALDDIEARNRAEIAARMGRPAPVGAATTQDVIAMTHSGVSEEVILTHIRNHGTAQVLTSNDLIYLQQQGVSPRVVQAMQSPPRSPVVVHEVVPAPPQVIVQEHYVAPPCYPPPYWHRPYRHRHYHHHHGGPHIGFGISIRD